jgi:hypothetical protein
MRFERLRHLSMVKMSRGQTTTPEPEFREPLLTSVIRATWAEPNKRRTAAPFEMKMSA